MFAIALFIVGLTGMFILLPVRGPVGGKELLRFSLPVWMFLALSFYIIFEMFLLYYKKDFFGEPIRTFLDFMGKNIILALVSVVLATLVFPAFYVVRNVASIFRGYGSWINRVFEKLLSMLATGITLLQDNLWVVYGFLIVVVIQLIKYWLYTHFIEGKR